MDQERKTGAEEIGVRGDVAPRAAHGADVADDAGRQAEEYLAEHVVRETAAAATGAAHDGFHGCRTGLQRGCGSDRLVRRHDRFIFICWCVISLSPRIGKEAKSSHTAIVFWD